jgi:cytochrome c oxidase assembly factor 5
MHEMRQSKALLRMSKSCSGMLEELLRCVENSPCVAKEGHSLRACTKGIDGATFPGECETKRGNYFACRKGQLDMRSRLRGNKGY